MKHLISLGAFLIAFALGLGLWFTTAHAGAAPRIYVANSSASTQSLAGCAIRVHNVPPFVWQNPWPPLPPGFSGPIETTILPNTSYDVRVFWKNSSTYKTQVVAVGNSDVTATFQGP